LSLKDSSRASYLSVLHSFEDFCVANYEGRTADEIVSELKSILFERRDEALFGVLQDYINWLIKRDLSHKTINNHFKIIMRYFSYQGIRVDSVALRQNVTRPKAIKEKLHPLTLEEIRAIFFYAPVKRRILYLVLIGTGMRIRECVALRKKDFCLDHPKRIKIEIPAQFTKNQTAHTTFVSKEASEYLTPHLKKLGANALVFATNQNPYHASMTEIEAFSRYRNRAGLTDKYASSNRHHVTLHSFRSYFFTRARRVHDTDIAHAMVGHTTYLGMYDRKEDFEKLELYMEVEPLLYINSKDIPQNEKSGISTSLGAKLRSSLHDFARINDIHEFQSRIRADDGYILITDHKKGHRIHKPSCSWLTAKRFAEKVVVNSGKVGSYYWCNESTYHNNGSGFKNCKFCIAIASTTYSKSN
jgi:integrase